MNLFVMAAPFILTMDVPLSDLEHVQCRIRDRTIWRNIGSIKYDPSLVYISVCEAFLRIRRIMYAGMLLLGFVTIAFGVLARTGVSRACQ